MARHKREVRHPYQILEASEFVVGDNYAFIYNASGSDPSTYSFGGIVEYSVGKDENSILSDFVSPPSTSERLFMVHKDGWYQQPGYPVLIYWRHGKEYDGWDQLTTFLGEETESMYVNHMIVSGKHWSMDPTIHPSPVKRKISSSSVQLNPANWEQEMRKRTHDAMAKVLGF
jgi:hypothetical protein